MLLLSLERVRSGLEQDTVESDSSMQGRVCHQKATCKAWSARNLNDMASSAYTDFSELPFKLPHNEKTDCS